MDHRDPTTGRCTLRVIPRHADRVHYEEGGSPATINSPVVQNGQLVTSALKVSFLAVDTTGVHQSGPPQSWQNTIDVKYDIKYRNGLHRLILKAVPQGTIKYSLDGSDPKNGAVYNEEFSVPEGTPMVLAIAEHSGVASAVTKVPIPALAGLGGQQFKPIATQKAEWTRKLIRTDRGGSYKLLEALERQAAKVGGANINVAVPGSENWVNISFGRNIVRTAAEIEQIADQYVRELGQNGAAVDVSLFVLPVYFDSGTALEEAANELGEPLNSDEVKQ